MRRNKKSKYRHVVIKKKKYYFYSITWEDITADGGHANSEEFSKFKPSVMVTQAYLFSKDHKYVRTFASYEQNEDLFSDRPHLGSYSYEICQPNLDLESTLGFEISTKYEKNKFSSSVTAFNNYSPNYHLFSKIGNGYVPGSDWIEWGSGSTGWLYKYRMKGIEANISGLEFDLSYKVNNATFSVDYSTVIGEDITASMPLPYMPASKARGRISFKGKNNLSYTFQAVKGFDQKRLGQFEDQTDGYICMDLYGSYSINRKNGSHKIIFQIDNIFDQIYYNHLSRIKSIMPETGRSITLQYRFLF